MAKNSKTKSLESQMPGYEVVPGPATRKSAKDSAGKRNVASGFDLSVIQGMRQAADGIVGKTPPKGKKTDKRKGLTWVTVRPKGSSSKDPVNVQGKHVVVNSKGRIIGFQG